MKNINRISIIGGAGTGKTTLSNAIGRVLNLPVCHIDGIHHLPNWQIRDKKERDEIILKKIKEDKWVIDGTYSSTLDARLKASDLIIYLDYSSFAQIRGVMGRFLKNGGKEKPEIPGCKEQMNKEFFFWVLKWRRTKRAAIIEAIDKVDKDKVLIFKSRRDLNRWFKKEFGEKIAY